ncbi:hypothetical protein M9H77_28322 [Catharanthus roseus]|uniref:Uncharacterized protein n=1 Tax=Catharanthus roseus TaxID=4058 RepID=A0ACC0AFD9_CATRO|nr:hypothetical protein M9H77_28322 [Catharanthus roseus]
MKKERSNLSKIEALKTLKIYVLVRDVLRMRLNLSVSISVVQFQKRAHLIFLYKEIGRPFLETGRPVFLFAVKNISVTQFKSSSSQAHLVTLFLTLLIHLDYSGFGKYLGVDSR